MLREKIKRMYYKKRTVLRYNVAFMIIVAMIAIFLAVNGRTFVHTADGYEQYYPVFLYIGKYLRGIFAGQGIKLYDFSIGLGEGVINALNYYGFGDPFSLLAVFATEHTGEYIYAIAVLLRIYLAGLGMIYFLKEHGFEGAIVSGGGILYAFSLYTIGQGLSFYTWMNMMYLLPFLLIKVERIIKEERVAQEIGKFAILIFISACSGFYYLYMLTIWVFLYSCFYYWYLYDKDFSFRHLVVKIGQMFAGYLVGVMAAGVILFPAVNGFFESSRGVGSAEKWCFFPEFFVLKENFSNLIIPMVGNAHPGLAISFLSIISIIGMWYSRNKSSKIKITFLCLLIAYFCPAFGRIMNGFGYTSNRWIYVVYFAVVYITVVMLEDYLEGEIPTKVLLIATIVSVVSILYHFILNTDRIRSAVYLVACLFVAFVLVKRKFTRKKIAMLLVGGAFLNVFFLFVTWRVCGHDLTTAFCTKSEINELNSLLEEGKASNEWMRKDLTGFTPADSLLCNDYRVTEHFSLLNNNTYSIWRELLVSPGIGHATHNLRGMDARVPIETLVGVGIYEDGDDLKENSFALPLSFQYSESITNKKFENLSTLTKQKILLEKIVLEDDYGELDPKEEKSKAEIEIPYEVETVNIDVENDVWRVDENSKIILSMNSMKRDEQLGEYYISFSDFQCMDKDFATTYIGDTKLYVQNRMNNYYTGLEDYLVHTHFDDYGKVEITFQEEYYLKLRDIKVFWYSYEGMKESTDQLRAHSLQNMVFSNNKVSGNIDAISGWLFFSIPYDSSWKLYVDGIKTEIVKANIGFMAARIDAGKHEIELVYDPVCFKMGMTCTIGGLGIICVLIFGRGIYEIKKGTAKRRNKEDVYRGERLQDEDSISGFRQNS